MPADSASAQELIARLGLEPHPEGGWYGETWRDQPADGGRGVGTAIHFLLEQGQSSHWHRVDAVEIWHFYAGAPLDLRIWAPGGPVQSIRLGPDVLAGETPQAIVPEGAWQAASAVEGWTLVGCTVSPAFQFSGWELAPAGWEPPVSGL
jgi:uncharacterized protein